MHGSHAGFTALTKPPRQVISKLLDIMGVPHVIEDPVWDIDIAIFDTRTAIEVDGPNHFTRNTKRPLGRYNSGVTRMRANVIPIFQ